MLVLLTGGLGYIGSHVCVSLLQNGHSVLIVDNLANASLDALTGIRTLVPDAKERLFFFQEDLLHKNFLVDLFRDHPINAVVHLAGLKAVAESLEQPLAYYHTNILTTLNLLDALETSTTCRQIIFSSSATVYGSQKSPLSEELPCGQGISSPYGKTKYFIEEILGDWQRSVNGRSVVILRYFNPVGAHPSGLIGEAPLGRPNNLLPILSKVAYAHNCRSTQDNTLTSSPQSLAVFGNDYATPDGTCVRDFIHVCDLAEAHRAALKNSDGLQVYNVGTGQGISVLALINAYQQYNNITIPYHFAPRRPGDLPETFCRSDKILRELSWQAKKSLREIVVDSWHWTTRSACPRAASQL